MNPRTRSLSSHLKNKMVYTVLSIKDRFINSLCKTSLCIYDGAEILILNLNPW